MHAWHLFRLGKIVCVYMPTSTYILDVLLYASIGIIVG